MTSRPIILILRKLAIPASAGNSTKPSAVFLGKTYLLEPAWIPGRVKVVGASRTSEAENARPRFESVALTGEASNLGSSDGDTKGIYETG